jgi:hypothetical protein
MAEINILFDGDRESGLHEKTWTCQSMSILEMFSGFRLV